MIARAIDQTAADRSAPRVLSIAAGHLREAEISEAVGSDAVSELVAFDQDPESLAVAFNAYSKHRISVVHGSIRSLLAGNCDLGRFDLIYAAGLFDYLAERMAVRLTSVMFGMLSSGGRLLLANFALPSATSRTWKLICDGTSSIVLEADLCGDFQAMFGRELIAKESVGFDSRKMYGTSTSRWSECEP